MKTYHGSCHCGAITFEAKGQLTEAIDCNCSICTKLGALLWMVPIENFRLVTGENLLHSYRFHTKQIDHVFCPVCGIHPYAKGKSPTGDEMIAINMNCIDDLDFESVSRKQFDGKSL